MFTNIFLSVTLSLCTSMFYLTLEILTCPPSTILNRNWPKPKENHKSQQYDLISPQMRKLWHKVSDFPEITKVETRI